VELFLLIKKPSFNRKKRENIVYEVSRKHRMNPDVNKANREKFKQKEMGKLAGRRRVGVD